MEFLRNHADRAVARQMLATGVMIGAAVVLSAFGYEFMAAANELGTTLGHLEIGN